MNKNSKTIAIIAGARPNFMKVAPLCHEFNRQGIDYFLINTGQHFNKEMSEGFFDEFKIKPHYSLNPRHESIARQFADIMVGIEDIFIKSRPVLVIVVGDVNSTLAGALAAHKMGIPLAHVEAGLRSYNTNMPEEINRIITDRLSNMLFAHSDEAVENLRREGMNDNIHLVGNIMIDTLEMFIKDIGEHNESFYLCTLHRPENVDNKEVFNEIIEALAEIARDTKIYLPLHPRTRKMAEEHGLWNKLNEITHIIEPLNYRDSLYYQKNAKLILTDSGGIQEESSYLGTPCITLRVETERPVTVTHGTNTVGGVSKESILKAYREKNLDRQKTVIPHWDGKTAERIIAKILEANVF